MLADSIQLHDISCRNDHERVLASGPSPLQLTISTPCGQTAYLGVCTASASLRIRLNAERTLPAAFALFQTPLAPYCACLHTLLPAAFPCISWPQWVGLQCPLRSLPGRWCPKVPCKAAARPGRHKGSARALAKPLGLISIVPEKMAALPSLNLSQKGSPHLHKEHRS